MPGVEHRCAPGLVCTDFPQNLNDAPGVCREPCPATDSGECLEPERYCSFPNDVCRDDGDCFDHLDCIAPGNEYPIDLCVGSVRCVSAACVQECGASDLCRNLDGIDFGNCLMFLGWGVSGAGCAPFSGCSTRGQPFFDSESKCRAGCGL